MPLIVGACEIRLVVRGSRSLKDKRQAVRSIKDRIAELFNVSVAEVDDLENWQSIVLGVAAVANERGHVRDVLQKVVDKVKQNPHAEFVDARIELM